MPQQQEIALLRHEVEILMNERQALLRVAGAAAALIAGIDAAQLKLPLVESADLVSICVNQLSEETLKDALESVSAHLVR